MVTEAGTGRKGGLGGRRGLVEQLLQPSASPCARCCPQRPRECLAREDAPPRGSAAEPCPASDAEPPLHCHVLLSILRRTPDKQHANDNERYEQHQEDDDNEGDIHTVVLPRSLPLLRWRRDGQAEGLWLKVANSPVR
jgi:hypothetical protein